MFKFALLLSLAGCASAQQYMNVGVGVDWTPSLPPPPAPVTAPENTEVTPSNPSPEMTPASLAPTPIQAFAGIYNCVLTGNAVPATEVSITCITNTNQQLNYSVAISSTEQTWSLVAPVKHPCDATWPVPCATTDAIYFTIQSQPGGPEWNISVAGADSGQTIRRQGKF